MHLAKGYLALNMLHETGSRARWAEYIICVTLPKGIYAP